MKEEEKKEGITRRDFVKVPHAAPRNGFLL